MPLKNGNTPEAIAYNIKKLKKEGYPHKQALAIALETARGNHKKHEKMEGKKREKVEEKESIEEKE